MVRFVLCCCLKFMCSLLSVFPCCIRVFWFSLSSNPINVTVIIVMIILAVVVFHVISYYYYYSLRLYYALLLL